MVLLFSWYNNGCNTTTLLYNSSITFITPLLCRFHSVICIWCWSCVGFSVRVSVDVLFWVQPQVLQNARGVNASYFYESCGIATRYTTCWQGLYFNLQGRCVRSSLGSHPVLFICYELFLKKIKLMFLKVYFTQKWKCACLFVFFSLFYFFICWPIISMACQPSVFWFLFSFSYFVFCIWWWFWLWQIKNQIKLYFFLPSCHQTRCFCWYCSVDRRHFEDSSLHTTTVPCH